VADARAIPAYLPRCRSRRRTTQLAADVRFQQRLSKPPTSSSECRRAPALVPPTLSIDDKAAMRESTTLPELHNVARVQPNSARARAQLAPRLEYNRRNSRRPDSTAR